MFVILNIVESGKRKIKRGKTVDNVRDVQTSCGERFYIVDVCDSEKGVNWDEVSYFIGKHSKKVLMDKQFGFPEFTSLARFDAIHFKNILLFNTLEMILKEMYLSGIRVRCIINDKSARYSSQLQKVVRFSSQTTVVTDNSFRYFSDISNIYEKYGAGVTVTESMPDADEKTFIIDTSGEMKNVYKGYLFSAKKAIHPLNVEGYNHLKVLCPAYIEHIDFLGAVYEMNRDKSLEEACCADFMYNNEKKTVFEMISHIKGNISSVYDNNKSIIFYL